MPYSIITDHPECEAYAVIKDEGRELMGCHRTIDQAEAQLTALNIAEYGDRALPENYRPADSEDVPEGRACSNCVYYEAGYCALWDENVQADYYCNRWVMLEEEDIDTERAESYTPTSGMVEEAKRGLAWRREFGRGGTEIGVARARDISNGRNLPLETVKRVYSYFARHEVDKKAEGFRSGEDGYPSNGRIAWALWGGDPGKTWADAIVARERNRVARAIIILNELQNKI
ncbi:MAG: hypothetical protein JW384_01776 [Nitrosomonadaceae bacterium]|nr:hypothetical protein [Nitrosomonadaceae bacterium]